MMNRLQSLIVAVAMCVYLPGCDTESSVENPDVDYFIKYYGGDGNQSGVDMVVLPDGTFLLLGNYAISNIDTDLYLLRVTAEGETIWQQRIGEDEQNSIWTARDIEPTLDGKFVVLADYQAPGTSHCDVRVLKVTGDGAVLADKMMGSTVPANDFGRSITPLKDGGFIVTGTTEATATFAQPNVPNPDLGDAFKFRLDTDLNPLSQAVWTPVYEGFGGRYDETVKITQYDETTFYGFGYSNTSIWGNNNEAKLGLIYFVVKDDGTSTNPAFPGGPDEVAIQFVLPVADALGGGILGVGTAFDQTQQSRIFIVRLRSQLNFASNDILLSTSLTLGRNLQGVAAASSVAGERGFFVLGNEIRTSGATNIWLSKIDQTGGVLWSTTWGSEAEDDRGAAVTELPDGKIVVLGTMGLADNQTKMALIKVNRQGRFSK